MYQKCQLSGILTFKAFPIKSICCTIQGLNTQIHPQMHRNLTHANKQHSDTLWETPETSYPHLQTTWHTDGAWWCLLDPKRHQQMPFDVNLNVHTSWNNLFGCHGRSVGVAGCQFVSVVVLNCPKITGGGFWKHNNCVCVCFWDFNASKGVYEWLRLGWWSKCSILEKLQKAKFHTHDTFETSNSQTRPIKAPWKS